jgi:hypothetical protein
MTYVKSYASHMEVKNGYEYVFSCPSSLILSFAVWLVDDYTQKEPIGEVRVTLKGENITTVKAVKNLSGYHTFSGLPEGRYTLYVESELYFPEKKPVDTSSSCYPEEPEVVRLRPRPLYPFPDRTTLIIGMLDADPLLLAGITVKVASKVADWKIPEVVQGIPDENGEFVLYFREAIKGTADVDLEITGEGIYKIVSASIEEGKSTYTGVISIP